MRVWTPMVAALAIALMLTNACSSGSTRQNNNVVTGGSPNVGKQLIIKYGCGSCHTIPGIRGASALVGPPLIHWSRRSFIAGELANTPDNLVRWITNPKDVEAGTDMPNLGVTQDEARSIAAYLMTIR
jgi:cytochrome c